jgi:hypothetical protein
MALIERAEPDNLIATNAHTATVQTVTVKAGEGDLKRGTVLARNSSDKFVVACTAQTGDAEVILAQDADATGGSDVIAEVYNSGDFFENALITKEETTGTPPDEVTAPYALTEADRLNLKNAGIYLIAGLD